MLPPPQRLTPASSMPEGTPPADAAPSHTSKSSWWLVATLFACTLIAYLPALRAGFTWNDADYVTSPELRSLHGLWRIWFDLGSTQQYYPLLHSAFWVQHQLFGDEPSGYHIANVLLHASAACLFALFLRRLAVPGAWLAGFLFALHPVCVESVAWITEQKNTLSLVFYLAAGLAYLSFDEQRKGKQYALALALFICALLSKTTTGTLPAGLLVVFWWKRGRIEWRRDVLPLLPWFALATGMGLFSASLERTQLGAVGDDFALTFTQRSLLAGRIVWFYLYKFFWPTDLIFIYPRWVVDPSSIAQWLFPLGLLALVAALWAWRGRSRTPIATLLLFAGSLFPVLGFFNVFGFLYSYVADHWQYLPCIALAAFAAAGISTGLARFAPPVRWTAMIVLLATLGTLSWRQSRMYEDRETFYRTTIERNPECWMAYNNLARLLVGDPAHVTEAIILFEKSLELHPTNTVALCNLGIVLVQTGRAGEAVVRLQEAVRLDPRDSQAQNILGFALAQSGRLKEAKEAFGRAAQMTPNVPEMHDNWGMACQALGEEAEAQQHFAEAARLRAEAGLPR